MVNNDSLRLSTITNIVTKFVKDVRPDISNQDLLLKKFGIERIIRLWLSSLRFLNINSTMNVAGKGLGAMVTLGRICDMQLQEFLKFNVKIADTSGKIRTYWVTPLA